MTINTDIVTLYFDNSVGRLVNEHNENCSSYKFGYYDEHDDFIEHCEDGPAYTCEYGSLYFIHGKEVTAFAEMWLKERNIDQKNMSEEDKLALSFYMRSLV